MSTVQGGQGNIVTNGLVLNLDAANPRSYLPPYNGTTWFNLASNSNNGTLTNGPTYNSANGGSIVFDGIDEYVNLGDNDLFSFTSGGGVDIPFSISAWIRLSAYGTGVAGYSALIFKSQEPSANNWQREWTFSHNNTLGFVFSVYTVEPLGGNRIGRTNNSVIPLNTWRHLTATYNASKTVSGITLYMNGVQQSTTDLITGTYTGMINTTTTVEFGRQYSYSMFSGGDGGLLNGNISSVQIYRNKVLSASEVNQNFQATRARFGI